MQDIQKELSSGTAKMVGTTELLQAIGGGIWEWKDSHRSVEVNLSVPCKFRDSGSIRFSFVPDGGENNYNDIERNNDEVGA